MDIGMSLSGSIHINAFGIPIDLDFGEVVIMDINGNGQDVYGPF